MAELVLACVAEDGSRVKAEAFTNQKKYGGVVPSDLKSIDYSDVEQIDNGNLYEWYEVGVGKYGRNMYCPKTNTLRSQTMGEFYGGSKRV